MSQLLIDLTHAPLLHVVTGRNGPGYIDVITPGVFMNEQEQQRLIERMDAQPPALVLWPEHDFDKMPSRSVRVTAPLVTDWVSRNYRRPKGAPHSNLLVPRSPLER